MSWFLGSHSAINMALMGGNTELCRFRQKKRAGTAAHVTMPSIAIAGGERHAYGVR